MSHQIDSLAYGNRLRWLPPSHKLSFAIVLLILSLISPPIVQGLISIWVFIWIVHYAKIPVNIYLKLLALPLSFWIASFPAFVINVLGYKPYYLTSEKIQQFPFIHSRRFRLK